MITTQDHNQAVGDCRCIGPRGPAQAVVGSATQTGMSDAEKRSVPIQDDNNQAVVQSAQFPYKLEARRGESINVSERIAHFISIMCLEIMSMLDEIPETYS